MSHPKVELHIQSYGVITLELDADKAPKSVANFLSYVADGHYDQTIFHQKPTSEPIENEANNGLKNDAYTIAMARTQAPHSATAQFFINVSDNDFLNHTAPSLQGWGYAVFGKVVSGTEVVDKIRAVPTGRQGFHDDVPKEPILIEKAVAV